jgi:hypothetical protein
VSCDCIKAKSEVLEKQKDGVGFDLSFHGPDLRHANGMGRAC